MAAGAQQDYGSVINWLRADPYLCERVKRVNETRNAYANFDDITRDKPLGHFNEWKQQLPPIHRRRLKNFGAKRLRALADDIATANGEQLAGSGYHLGDGKQYRKLTRDAHPFPINWQVFENGRWIPVPLSGGSANALSTYPTVLQARAFRDILPAGRQLQGGFVLPPTRSEFLTEGPTVDVRRGLSPLAFARAFPPIAYRDPFSSPDPAFFPKQFSPLYDPTRDIPQPGIYQ